METATGILSNFRSSFRNVFFTPILYGAIASLTIFLSAWEQGDRLRDRFQDRFRNKEDTFDFIVVGSGSAGSVVASRLSEFFDVLLLEAGGEPHPFQGMPGLTKFQWNYPQVDWCYRTTQQKRACLISNNKECSWSGGKGLGGSGNLGLMSYLRGNPLDYDLWAQIADDENWDYDHVLPYFKKMEDFNGNTSEPDSHGHGGDLRIEIPDYNSPAKEFIWAANELGFPHVDLNGEYTEGFDTTYYTGKRGVRQSPYRAFLKPIRKRKGLTIRKFAHVTKLMLRNNDNGAYGLEYRRHGKMQKAYAHREIVLSAGTVQTPKILLHSGIGPEQHLTDMGIKCRYDSPVGQNLQDHLTTYVGPFFIDEARTLSIDRDVTARSFFQYGTFGVGPLTTTGEMANGMVVSTQAKNRGEDDWPDIRMSLMGVSVYKNFAADMAHSYNLKRDTVAEYYKHAIGKDSFHIGTTVARPIARGEVRLTGKNPLTDEVSIDPNYLEDRYDLDMKVMLEGVKLALQLVENTTAYQNLGGRFTKEVLPGCEHVKFRSEEYFECYIRKYAISSHDYVGTCAMGKRGSQYAVVDSEMRVIGANNLRVIDASVIPIIPVGTTEASVLMLAQKGAEMMLDYWKTQEPDVKLHYSDFANSLRPGKTPVKTKETSNIITDGELNINLKDGQIVNIEILPSKDETTRETFLASNERPMLQVPYPFSPTSSRLRTSSSSRSRTRSKTRSQTSNPNLSTAAILSKRMKSPQRHTSPNSRIQNLSPIPELEIKQSPITNINPESVHTVYPPFSPSSSFKLTKAIATQEFTYIDDKNSPTSFLEPKNDGIYIVKPQVENNNAFRDIETNFSEKKPLYIIKMRNNSKKNQQNTETKNPKENPPNFQKNLRKSNTNYTSVKSNQSERPNNAYVYLPTYEVSSSNQFPSNNVFSPHNSAPEIQQDFTRLPVQTDFSLNT